MLTCKMRDVFTFNVKLVWCNQRSNKSVQLLAKKSSFVVLSALRLCEIRHLFFHVL